MSIEIIDESTVKVLGLNFTPSKIFKDEFKFQAGQLEFITHIRSCVWEFQNGWAISAAWGNGTASPNKDITADFKEEVDACEMGIYITPEEGGRIFYDLKEDMLVTHSSIYPFFPTKELPLLIAEISNKDSIDYDTYVALTGENPFGDGADDPDGPDEEYLDDLDEENHIEQPPHGPEGLYELPEGEDIADKDF